MKKLLLIVSVVLILLTGCLTTSTNGKHIGYITASDLQGIIWKNYDVYFKTDNSSSQEDLYCLERDNYELVKRMQEAQEKGAKVEIKYRTEALVIRCNSSDIIEDIIVK